MRVKTLLMQGMHDRMKTVTFEADAGHFIRKGSKSGPSDEMLGRNQRMKKRKMMTNSMASNTPIAHH